MSSSRFFWRSSTAFTLARQLGSDFAKHLRIIQYRCLSIAFLMKVDCLEETSVRSLKWLLGAFYPHLHSQFAVFRVISPHSDGPCCQIEYAYSKYNTGLILCNLDLEWIINQMGPSGQPMSQFLLFPVFGRSWLQTQSVFVTVATRNDELRQNHHLFNRRFLHVHHRGIAYRNFRRCCR